MPLAETNSKLMMSQRMTQILFGIIVLLMIASRILIWLRVRNDHAVGELWRSLETPPATETFTPEMVADLPEP